jgi:membrane protein DedA with SNARE-associated domain
VADPIIYARSIFSSHTLHHLLGTYGYAAVFVFVAVESLGVPFPGETMLIAAAVYAGATHHLEIAGVVAAAAAGAIGGDNVGYGVGHWGGYRILRRYGHYVRLNEARLKLGRWMFMRHGGKVVFFGRFVSVLRTYAAFLAGTNRMHWRRFLAFNAAGGIIWASIYGFGYYEFGSVLKSLSTPVDVALGSAAGLILVAVVIYVRRHEKRLIDEAERALPGPLDMHMPGEGERKGKVGERK